MNKSLINHETILRQGTNSAHKASGVQSSFTVETAQKNEQITLHSFSSTKTQLIHRLKLFNFNLLRFG